MLSNAVLSIGLPPYMRQYFVLRNENFMLLKMIVQLSISSFLHIGCHAQNHLGTRDCLVALG